MVREGSWLQCGAAVACRSAWGRVRLAVCAFDWARFCYKMSLCLNPFYLMMMAGFNPEVLRETDFKGALGCFLMLTWALIMTGRIAYVGTMYTSALTGVVVQYALLQARACYAPDAPCGDGEPCEGVPHQVPPEYDYDPLECPGAPSATGGFHHSSLDSGCSCCETSTTSVAAGQVPRSVRGHVVGQVTGPQTRYVPGSGFVTPKQNKPPGLAAVAAALAFCSLPLSVCAIVAQFLVDGVSPLVAPLPAAWCTLLAVCALLPPDKRQADRAFVIVPSGVMFTWLTLIFIV